jgi:hypothetical protein
MMTAVGQKADFSGAKSSGNTMPWKRLGRFADRQTRQGEPSGSKAVLPVAHSSRNSLVAIKSAFP